MKEEQLKVLIKEIVKTIISEYTSYTDQKQMVDDNPQLDPSVPPTDAMTSAEKSRFERQSELDRQKKIKQKQLELDVKKKKVDFDKKMMDQQKRFDIPNLNKDIQRLKGASGI